MPPKHGQFAVWDKFIDMARRRIPIEERFWKRVAKAGPDDCWEWTGGKTKHGYGTISTGVEDGCRTKLAHRVSWELANGPLPERT